MRARAAVRHLSTILRPSPGLRSSHSGIALLSDTSTNERISVLPSLVLVWPSNWGCLHLDRQDRRQPFADVLALQGRVLVLDEVLGLGEVVDGAGERPPQPLFVGAAFVGVDVVGEGEDRLGVPAGPLHRQFQLTVLAGRFDVEDPAVQGFARAVEVLDEVDEPALVFEDLVFSVRITLVDQLDLEALVEEGHLLESGGDRGVAVLGGFREDVGIGPEGDGGARSLGRLPLLDRRLWLAEVIGLGPLEAVANDHRIQPARQGVDDRDPDSVEST